MDVAYIPINSGDPDNKSISPERYASALRGMPCIGGSISRDIKHGIIPFLDDIDDLAKSIQSVNTVIVKPGGKLKGYNSDALGFRLAILNGMQQSGLNVSSAICYGYGGVASVVTTILADLGIEVFLVGRSMETAATRAAELGVKLWNGENVDLFVNATPATERPLHEAPHLLEALATCRIAFDHEMPGKYLEEHCLANNIYHIKGLDMYYPQMCAQWQLFLEGIVAPERVEELLRQADGK